MNVYLLVRPESDTLAAHGVCPERMSMEVFASTMFNALMLGVKVPKLLKLKEVWQQMWIR